MAPLPANATPQQAAFAAALRAWPQMPTTLQHLPLRMALEEDDADDPRTKRAKEAARAAADEALRKAQEEQDAKMRDDT